METQKKRKFDLFLENCPAVQHTLTEKNKKISLEIQSLKLQIQQTHWKHPARQSFQPQNTLQHEPAASSSITSPSSLKSNLSAG